MAYVTPIGSSPAQVEYRLGQSHGCTAGEAHEVQFSYHADGRERPLVWTGRGLPELGLTAGAVLEEAQFDTARALMAGVDPRTGERLVEPKLAVFEDAKVTLVPLVGAVQARAEELGVAPESLFTSVKNAKAYQRAVRAVTNDGAGARLRADDAGRLADNAGVDATALWGEQAYTTALGNLGERRSTTRADGSTVEEMVPRRKVIGNLGYDISLTLPKSHSLLLAFADEDTAAAVEKVYTTQVGATLDWLEEQTAYGMRGHHGDGASAVTVKGSGFLGWTMVHRAARPVGDRVVGDPHWHVHTTIANMTRGADGQWSTVAAGGRDLMRHAPAADHVLKALIRRTLTESHGVSFARSERTGAWEVAAIPDATLRAFSKRGASIEAMLRDLGFDPEQASRRAEDLAAAQTRHGKTHTSAAPDATLRSMWQQEARELGVDPVALGAAALPGVAAAGASSDGEPRQASVRERDQQQYAAVLHRLTDPEHGLTSHQRRFTRVEAIAAVADAMAGGAADVAEIETLTDRVLTDRGFIPLTPAGAGPVQGPEQVRGWRAVVNRLDPRQLVGRAHSGLPAVTHGARRQRGAGHMRNATRFTTSDVVEAEETILRAAAAARPGQGAVHVTAGTADGARQVVEVGQGFDLSTEQAAIVRRLVTSDQALDAVLGPPGTGKTTLMRAARAGWEAGGFTVAGAATAAVAAQNLQTESGIASRTVAQWVHRIREGEKARALVANSYRPVRDGTPATTTERAAADRKATWGLDGIDVLVLDEANLTDDRDRAVLYGEAARVGTKLVEVGDPQQLRGVGCGSLFGRVHQLVDGAALTANRRQVDVDERDAITAWRQGRYAESLTSWAQRGRLVATDTGDQALTAMVATWMTQRSGAPDPHTEMRGVVMLAASNEAVARLNDAAQAVRAATGELGAESVYEVAAGREVCLREGDHVLLRLNDRQQRMHDGPDVLNGYRGVVERINPDTRAVHVAWQVQGPDGHRTERAALTEAYVAKGGVSLGYAMTAHKAEGLTVAADWTQTDGVHQGGTVLVHGPGMDEPGLHVATSRHKDRMFLFAGRDQVESINTSYEKGTPVDNTDLQGRVVAALAEQARTRTSHANDTPVLDDLGRAPQRPPAAPTQQPPAVRDPAETRRRLQELAARTRGRTTTTTTPDDPARADPTRTGAARADAAQAAAVEAAAKRAAALREQERQRRLQGPRGPRQR